MVRAVLRLRHKTSAWASWLPHWPTCMCANSREDPIGFDSRFLRVSTYFTEIRSGLWLFLIGSAVPEERLARSHHAVTRSHKFRFSPAAISDNPPLGRATSVINLEPHTGARPSVRLRVGLINFLLKHSNNQAVHQFKNVFF